MTTYPKTPGFKSRGTSSAAARRIASRAPAIRDRVYAFLKANHPSTFTADEVAAELESSILSVRPRVTELLHSNLIERSDERRKNTSGMLAQCWRAKVTP